MMDCSNRKWIDTAIIVNVLSSSDKMLATAHRGSRRKFHVSSGTKNASFEPARPISRSAGGAKVKGEQQKSGKAEWEY